MENILVFGAAGQARSLIDIIEKEGKYKIAGFIDRDLTEGEEVGGYRVLGGDEAIADLLDQHNIKGGIVAVGDNWIRKKVRDKVLEISPGFNFINAIHPSAQIGKGAKIGRGIAMMAGTIANCYSSIGDFCVLNTNSSLDHDSHIGQFSSLGPGATVAGYTQIGEFSAICLGANVLDRVKIGSHTVIGSGALANKDFPNNVVAYGVPARVIRSRKPGDSYLSEGD